MGRLRLGVESPISNYLRTVLDECRGSDGGSIPQGNAELARADTDLFGIALATVGGSVYTAGDAEYEFSVQSIAKTLAYALALDDRGRDAMAEVVDTEPSGDSFNEISLEPETGRPRNALINAGALAVHSMIEGASSENRAERVRLLHSRLAGRELSIDAAVHEAELEADDRNTGIAHLLKAVGVLGADPAEVVDGYARQCAISVNCRDLATIAAVMANGGISPETGERLLDTQHNRHVLSVMATCGMYDGTGSWISTVGIPAKSGVAGAIIGVLPGQVGIAVVSPNLNEHGNSVRGVAVFERLSRDLELHMMHVSPTGDSAVRTTADGENEATVELQGDLRFAGAESILVALSRTTARALVLDFEHVRAIDDAARSLLQHAVDRLREENRDVTIRDPQNLMSAP